MSIPIFIFFAPTSMHFINEVANILYGSSRVSEMIFNRKIFQIYLLFANVEIPFAISTECDFFKLSSSRSLAHITLQVG